VIATLTAIRNGTGAAAGEVNYLIPLTLINSPQG
jgi:hypothetical protein